MGVGHLSRVSARAGTRPAPPSDDAADQRKQAAAQAPSGARGTARPATDCPHPASTGCRCAHPCRPAARLPAAAEASLKGRGELRDQPRTTRARHCGVPPRHRARRRGGIGGRGRGRGRSGKRAQWMIPVRRATATIPARSPCRAFGRYGQGDSSRSGRTGPSRRRSPCSTGPPQPAAAPRPHGRTARGSRPGGSGHPGTTVQAGGRRADGGRTGTGGEPEVGAGAGDDVALDAAGEGVAHGADVVGGREGEAVGPARGAGLGEKGEAGTIRQMDFGDADVAGLPMRGRASATDEASITSRTPSAHRWRVTVERTRGRPRPPWRSACSGGRRPGLRAARGERTPGLLGCGTGARGVKPGRTVLSRSQSSSAANLKSFRK